MPTKPYQPLAYRYVVTNRSTRDEVVLEGFHHEIVRDESDGIVSNYIRVVHGTGQSLLLLPKSSTVIRTRKGLDRYPEVLWFE